MKLGSIFSGIGGFDVGFERAGFEIAWQVEIDKFCRRVLEKHWPSVMRFGDVRAIEPEKLPPVDVVAGGPPCQPFSSAGKRRGAGDPRNLWPEMLRVVRGVRPSWVVFENVPGIVSSYLPTVCHDLESAGYQFVCLLVPACALGASHWRYRLFVVAHLESGGREGRSMATGWKGKGRSASDVDRNGAALSNAFLSGLTDNQGRRGQAEQERRPQLDPSAWECFAGWPPEPDVVRVVYGVPAGMVKPRIAALGNAVVPQITEWIARCILAAGKR